MGKAGRAPQALATAAIGAFIGGMTAAVLAAFQQYGLQPGPLLFDRAPDPLMPLEFALVGSGCEDTT